MEKLVNGILAIVVILVVARVALFILGVAISIIWNLLVLAVCFIGIFVALKYFQERK